MMRQHLQAVVRGLAVACVFSCLSRPASAANFDVTTGEMTFSPATLTINVGDTVTFTNTSQGIHNVHANDNSFRCANGCDGQGGDGSLSSNRWSFQLAFNQPGTVGFYCDNHGFPGGGMHGTITVMSAPAGNAGVFGFSSGGYTVAENAGSASITVLRTGGSSGAASVQYATSDGTAVAGVNYRAASGTLSWGDGDASPKSFSVAVLDDGVVDGSHTVNLSLSHPTGGATLGGSAVVLTITDADHPAGGPPAAPTDLTAAPVDTTSIHLAWKSTANNADFHVQLKPLDGSPFADGGLPLVPAGTTSLTVSGLQPATGYGFRVRAENGGGSSSYSAEADAATTAVPGACIADAKTLCLGAGGRFKASVAWVTADGKGAGTAIPLASNPDSGLFYFFGPGNIEMLIKVLNACVPPFDSYWVFFAATTNVQITVTVVDTKSGQTRVYFNPLNQAALPIQDTAAFPTCP
ncbi:MAG TPA: Calx-beta domain-containing protein [Thermoanaerobaculia bacterium]|nr:Calx-beta domain-containing protein [Thermoanaerobaculia bacterium]